MMTRCFHVGHFEVTLESRDGLVRWSFQSGDSTFEGLQCDDALAESDARKAAISLILQERGGVLA
jgi:hypothetical protein